MVFQLCGLSLYGQGDQNNNPDKVADLKRALHQDGTHPDLFELPPENGTTKLKIEDMDNEIETETNFVKTQNLLNSDNKNVIEDSKKCDLITKHAWNKNDFMWAKCKSAKFFDKSSTVIDTNSFIQNYPEPQKAWSDLDDKKQVLRNEVEEDENCCWMCLFGQKNRKNVVHCSPLLNEESIEETVITQMWVDVYQLFK